MARKTSEELRQEADRQDAIEQCRKAIKALTAREYGAAMMHTSNADALAQKLYPPPVPAVDVEVGD